MNLGGGADTLNVPDIEPAAFGNLHLLGGTGDDIFDVRFEATGLVHLNGDAGIDTVLEINGQNLVIDNNGAYIPGTTEVRIVNWMNVEGVRVNGTPDADVIDASGFAGDTFVQARNGSDLVMTGLGNDTIFGGGDDDTLIGGPGNDSIRGGDGNDTITGGEGDDTLRGDDGTDRVMEPVAGITVLTRDALTSDLGTDQLSRVERPYLTGGAGNDHIDVSDYPGWVRVDAGDGDDYILGSRYGDVLVGQAGNDTIDGDFGDDAIRGDEGDDVLYGRAGNDTVKGG